MIELKRVADVKPFQKPQDSIFSTLINRKLSRVFTFYIIKWFPRVTPSQVSVLSFIVSVAGIALLVFPDWYWRLSGVALLQIGFSLDCSDGELSRAKNMASAYGAWLDSVLDRFKEVLMFSGLTAAWYIHIAAEPIVLIVGAAAIVGMLLVAYVREAKKQGLSSGRQAEFMITKHIYIGTVDVTIYLVCAASLLAIEYYVLWFFAIVSVPMLAKQMLSAYRRRNG